MDEGGGEGGRKSEDAGDTLLALFMVPWRIYTCLETALALSPLAQRYRVARHERFLFPMLEISRHLYFVLV